MLLIGCHLSSAKGYYAMGKDALSAGANTFQFFARNPRGGVARAYDPEDGGALLNLMRENRFGPIVAHAPYTLNVCSADEKVREFGDRVLAEDLARMENWPGNYYNLHPGSHSGQGAEEGIQLISAALNAVLTPETRTTVLLETMAGKGTEVGRSFEELRAILDRIELPEKMGVCLDTCHIFDAGYNLAADPEGVLAEFDRVIGLSRLRAVHLNDSKNPAGSRKDRHELLGEGQIGFEALICFAQMPAIRNLPLILETPTDLEGHAQEIKRIREAFQAEPVVNGPPFGTAEN